MLHDQTDIIEEMQEALFIKQGGGWFLIGSGSMSPLINVKDRVFAQKIEPAGVRARDIILFKYRDVFLVHRIVKIEKQNGDTNFLHKGDAGVNADRINAESVLGKVLLVEKNNNVLSLGHGLIKILNGLSGFINCCFYKFDLHIYCFNKKFKEKTGFCYLAMPHRILKKIYSLLWKAVMRALLKHPRF